MGRTYGAERPENLPDVLSEPVADKDTERVRLKLLRLVADGEKTRAQASAEYWDWVYRIREEPPSPATLVRASHRLLHWTA